MSKAWMAKSMAKGMQHFAESGPPLDEERAEELTERFLHYVRADKVRDGELDA